MSNPVIETDLKEILTKIDNRLERLEENMTTLKVSQARIEEKVDGLSKRAENIAILFWLCKAEKLKPFHSKTSTFENITTYLGLLYRERD
jgi:archaellum component FlaC